MKRELLFVWLCLFCLMAKAQDSDTADRIYINVVQPDREEIPAEAAKSLTNKLKQLITSNGIADEDPNNRFVLTAKANITSKDIVAGALQRVSQKIDFTLMIGDVIENKVYESYTISTVGVGINENKSFIAAINTIKPKSQEMKDFLQRGKDKIIDYYSARCAEIKQEASAQAKGGKYEEAIYRLMQVPNVCDCFSSCQELAATYYRSMINANASSLLNQAKAKWAQSPDAKGASEAAALIVKIPANSSSQGEVDSLIGEIGKKLEQDQQRDFEFKVKQYTDNVEKEKREYELRVQQQAADNALREKQQAADNAYRERQQQADNAYRENRRADEQALRQMTVKAYTAVGLAFASRQSDVKSNLQNLRYW